MRVLLVGLGSIGRRHLSNIKKNDPSAEIIVWHLQSKKNELRENINDVNKVAYSFDEAIREKPDVAFITCPSSLHISIAIMLAQEGIDLFIEKPISSNLVDVENFLRIGKSQKIVIMVGYNMRFHRPLQLLKQKISEGAIGNPIGIHAEVGQYLPDWRPGKDYRQSVSAQKELGGGAVLELSHELDYARWLFGEVKSVSAQVDQLSDLEIDVEDSADIILKFSNNAIGNIHLDMVQRFPTRYCHVVGSEGLLKWDGTTDLVTMFSTKNNEWSVLHPGEKIDRNEMYLTEIQHFFECVNSRKDPLINGFEGKRVLEIALAALESSKEQRNVIV
ncbi:MAG: Gfo/Idh/MocA family oxidoreductase [Methanoregula sp.]